MGYFTMTTHHRRFVALIGLLLLAAAGCKSGMVAERGDYSMNGSAFAGARMQHSFDPMSGNAFEQAREMERSGQMSEALQRYVQIAEANPNQPAVWQRMAVAYDKIGHREYATSCYEHAIELDPMNADVWCDFGYGQFLQGDFASAERSFRRALDINPNLERAHNNLGLAMAKLGNSASAVEQFRMAGCDGKQATENLKLALGAPIAAQPEPMPIAMQVPNPLPASMPAPELPSSAAQPAADLQPIAAQPAAELPVATQPLEAPLVEQTNSDVETNAEDVARLNDYATDPSLAKRPTASSATSPMESADADDAPKAFSTSVEKSFRPTTDDFPGVNNLISDFEDETTTSSPPLAESKSEVVRRIGVEKSICPTTDRFPGVYNLISDFEDETTASSPPPAESKSEVVRRIGDDD